MNVQAEQYILAGVVVVCASAVIALSLVLNHPLPDALVSAAVQILTAVLGYVLGKKSNGSNPL